MFRASSCPSSGATTTAVAASGLPSELGDSSAVGRGWASRPTQPRSTTLLSPNSDGKPEAATAVVIAPDDGHGDAGRPDHNQQHCYSGLGGLVFSVLASGIQDRGFKPGRSRRIFRAKKFLARLPSEGK
jgi:hypothetical protein